MRATSDGRGGAVLAFDFTTIINTLTNAHPMAVGGPVANLLALLNAETTDG